jgi:hypothetical protein
MIARSGNAQIGGMRQDADVGPARMLLLKVADDSHRAVVTTIVDNEELYGRIGLSQRRA